MIPPLIGLTTDREISNRQTRLLNVPEEYSQAVLRAGGAPVLIPIGFRSADLPELIDRLDGVILIGGGDIGPQHFHGQPHPRVGGVEPDRDELELTLVRLLVEADKPFLGICRGLQVMNVALGGTLFTDISAQKEHALRHDWYPNHPRDYLAHPVDIAAQTRLDKITGGGPLLVNSLHHQGIDVLSPHLTATAAAPDGLIEAVELPNARFGLGVQWHPEWLWTSPANQAIFQALVEAAGG